MSQPRFRPGSDADIDHVAQLLHRHMNAKVSPETFRRLMAYDWAGEKPHIGMVAEADGEIVGFHGNVYSMRLVDGVPRTFGSFTSLYVHKDWRGHDLGLKMMRTYEERADITYTVFDPSVRVHGILEACGFRDLDTHRLVWEQGMGEPAFGVEVVAERATIRAAVGAEEQRYLDDHASLPARPMLFRRGLEQVLSFFLCQDRGDQGLCFDLIYAGEPAMLARLIDGAVPALLASDPRARVLVDERFLAGHAAGGERHPLAYRRMVRRAAPVVPDWRVDHLYTETLLLGLKLG